MVSLGKGRLLGHSYIGIVNFSIYLHRYWLICYILIMNTYFVVLINVLNSIIFEKFFLHVLGMFVFSVLVQSQGSFGNYIYAIK